LSLDAGKWYATTPKIRDGYETGICVRAELPNGKIDSVDIAYLDKDFAQALAPIRRWR